MVELELYAGLDWPGGQDDKVIIPDGTKNGATYYVAGPVEDHSKGPVRGGQKVVNLTRLSN